MTHLRVTEHFNAPIDRVFELGIDFKRYPEWNVSYSEIKEIKGLPDRVGTKFVAVMKLLGQPIEGTSEILEIEKPHLLKIKATSPLGGFLDYVYKLTPVGTGTDFVLELDYELPVAIVSQITDKSFLEKTVERDLRHTLENFKAFVEVKLPVLV